MSGQADSAHLSQLSLLDVLRPAAGWSATDAVLSTYSLDLAVMTSAVLALTGRDNLEGGGTKVGLAAALSHFRPNSRNRLGVLVQTGRITTRVGSPQILTLLDRFIHEVRRDQRKASWHAKAALVRFETSAADAAEQAVEWRLWIGSRNLSREMSWDSGLVLTGMPERQGGPIAGLRGLAEVLFGAAEWPNARQARLLRELDHVRWCTPRGVHVKNIAWLNGTKAWRPDFPPNANALTVITPFFDSAALRVLEAEEEKCKLTLDCKNRHLLTTEPELERRFAHAHTELSRWSVSCLDSSEQAEVGGVEDDSPDDSSSSAESTEASEQSDEFVPLGLHAKIIACRHPGGVSLWMGSANVTRRAWQRNDEIVVALEGDNGLWEGIEALLLHAKYATNEFTSEREATPREQLDRLRNALCNLLVEQRVVGASIEVIADRSVREAFDHAEWVVWKSLGARLQVAPLGAPAHDFVDWPVRAQSVNLPLRESSLAGDTEFLQFRLSCAAAGAAGDDPPTVLSWVQLVPMVPALDAGRDKRLLARYLSPQQYLDWIHSLLEGYETDPEPWDRPAKPGLGARRQYGAHSGVGTPTVEALLKAWQQDRTCLGEVTDALERYFDSDVMRQHSLTEDDHRAIGEIAQFRRQLEQMVQALGGGAA